MERYITVLSARHYQGEIHWLQTDTDTASRNKSEPHNSGDVQLAHDSCSSEFSKSQCVYQNVAPAPVTHAYIITQRACVASCLRRRDSSTGNYGGRKGKCRTAARCLRGLCARTFQTESSAHVMSLQQ